MRLYLCSVKLGDSTQHVVPNKKVTIPEVAILRRLHGAAAVTNLRPYTENGKPAGVERTDAEERERLALRYNARGGENENIVEALFGPVGPLPRTLREVGIDPAAAAAEMRAQAEALAAAAADLTDEDEPIEDDLDAQFEAA